MMELNQTTINTMVKELEQSIDEHIIAKDMFFTNCNCSTTNQIGECFSCRVNKVIESLRITINWLKLFTKNTMNVIEFIDLEAFCYTLNEIDQIEKLWIEPVFNEGNESDTNYDSIVIFAKTSRYTMDGQGCHVGYENVIYKWEAISKDELEITGIPKLLSNWVVNPIRYDIFHKDFPEEDVPEHQMDCDHDDQEFLNCGCADMFEGYMHPDDDFFYQDMNHIIEQCNWIEAEFDPDHRIWFLGNISFNIESYQNDSDYADYMNEENGSPSFESYSN